MVLPAQGSLLNPRDVLHVVYAIKHLARRADEAGCSQIRAGAGQEQPYSVISSSKHLLFSIEEF